MKLTIPQRLLPEGRARIVTTGSRFWRQTILMFDVLEELTRHLNPKDVTIIHGKCDPTLNGDFVPWDVAWNAGGAGYAGADFFAEKFARLRGFHVEQFPADWSMGRQAGPIQNWAMLRSGADLCVGFLYRDSVGTRGCLKAATELNVPVLSFKGE